MKVLFRGLSFILGDYYNGIGFRQSVNGDTDEWDAKIYVENCHFEHGYRAVSIERTYRECRIIDSISYYACGDYAFLWKELIILFIIVRLGVVNKEVFIYLKIQECLIVKFLLPIKPGDINMMLLLLEVNTQFM